MAYTLDLTKQNINRILIIKWSALGDIAIASALFEDIYRAFPDASIDLNTLPVWAHLFKHDPRFNHIIDIDVRKKGEKFKAMRQWLKQIRQNRYDLVVDLQSNDRSRMFLTLLGLGRGRIRYRIGNNQQFPYNIRPPEKIRNTFKRCQSALKAGGINIHTSRPVIHYSEENKNNTDSISTEFQLEHKKYAVFFPGSQAEGYLKRWGAKNYADLAQMLLAQGVDKTLLIGASDELEECGEIARLGNNTDKGEHIINLCGKTKILDIVPLCKHARYIVANDTGTARIAAATTTPLLMIFGPTNPDRDTPGGENVAAIQAPYEQLSCIKCFRKTCGHHSCMKILTPDLVLKKLLKIPRKFVKL